MNLFDGHIFLNKQLVWDNVLFAKLWQLDIKKVYERDMVDIIGIVAHGNSHMSHHAIMAILQALAHKKSNVLD